MTNTNGVMVETVSPLEPLPLTDIESYNHAIRAFNNSGLSLDDYVQHIHSAGYKPATINHKINALKKSLFLYAERHGKDSTALKYQITDFFKRADNRPVKIDAAVTLDDCLTLDELNELRALPVKTALIIDALFQTAARVSELIHIKLDDCTQGKQGVKVQITHGKGGKSRTVYLSSTLYAEIVRTFKGKVYLFETSTGRQIDRQNIHKQIRNAGRAIGIENLHPHTLRHTWATLNLDKLGIYKTSHYLGHADIATTARFYLHNKPTESEILNLLEEGN